MKQESCRFRPAAWDCIATGFNELGRDTSSSRHMPPGSQACIRCTCCLQTVRWKPAEARPQTGVPAAPTFRPTPEQFKDPVAYINSIRPEAEKCAAVLPASSARMLPLLRVHPAVRLAGFHRRGAPGRKGCSAYT